MTGGMDMFTIQKLNNISSKGLDLFSTEKYEIASEIANPDAVLVRSYNMNDMELPQKLKAIARAGAGVNNIPVDKCTQKGIVVFNTPGANANAVKELALAALLLSSRKIAQGISWVQTQKGRQDEVPQIVEKGKSAFEGPELYGKTLGVIGLGAIGAMVANDAVSLGMKVIGYDPFISIDSAWGLSRSVAKAESLDHIFSVSDYISIHIPLTDKTKGMINKSRIDSMKNGVRIINLSRGGLIVNTDMIEAMKSGKVACYVTDFPEDELLGVENIICIPHLGASTPESEENCAVMAAKQLIDFLEKGNIKNSVNFPECSLMQTGDNRIIVANDNVPNMVGQVTSILAANRINIADMLHRLKGELGYIIIDIDGEISEETIESIKTVVGVKMVRVIKNI
jgi:D-3-phosphoglycerate dehydrogenase / 2-oxoglutarate reductase